MHAGDAPYRHFAVITALNALPLWCALRILLFGGHMTEVHLRSARPDDIGFIATTERIPGYEGMIGQSSEERHRAGLTDPDRAYLLGIDAAGERVAFAILCDVADAHGNVSLLRVAVSLPDQGIGSRFLREILRWVFAETAAYRFWLTVLPDNARARHVYASHGFVEEGVLRGAFRFADGRRGDLVMMSILRPDWLGRLRSACE